MTKWAGEQSDGGITCGRLHTGEKFGWKSDSVSWESESRQLLNGVRGG